MACRNIACNPIKMQNYPIYYECSIIRQFEIIKKIVNKQKSCFIILSMALKFLFSIFDQSLERNMQQVGKWDSGKRSFKD